MIDEKLISTVVIGILLFTGFGALASIGDNQVNIKKITEKLIISKPIFKENENYITIQIEESETYLMEPGKPQIPIITKTYTFPLGTKIIEEKVEFETENYEINKKIIPCPIPEILDTTNNKQKIEYNTIDEKTYNTNTNYPNQPYYTKSGAGLENNQHVLFYTIYIAPQYKPTENIISIPKEIKITMNYNPPNKPLFTQNNEYDMVIICPEQFSSNIQPLVDHKNSVDITTFIKTVEEIYSEYNGRDKPEQIKYFIKDAIENYGIKYALLLGDINLVPVRMSAIYQLNWDELIMTDRIPTDLYYSDIYDPSGEFCSWDSNNDGVFGEIYINHHTNEFNFPDDVDLYPDIGIGRTPCKNTQEVDVVVDKIIHYEKETYGSQWFNKAILMGGDTMPSMTILIRGDSVHFEGEWTLDNLIGPKLTNYGFNLVKLYASKDTFHPDKINEEISSGAGFVCYAGHGHMELIGTHPPNETARINYYKEDINNMNNDYKLPIFVIEGCLSGKMDYNIFDKIFPVTTVGPFNNFKTKLKSFLEESFHPNILPFFAESLIMKKSGGGIASIGAARWVSFINSEGYESGFWLLHDYFIEGYVSGIILSDMFVYAQNSYITMIIDNFQHIGGMWDRMTLDGTNLFGDPSLKVGGYPPGD